MKQYTEPYAPLGADGLLRRTGLAVGQSAPFVLLPGDPHRSKIISGFFRDAEFTAHRGTYATYTGHTENGTAVGVTSSGMGCSCIVNALEDLAVAGAKTVIRVGTCGGIQPWMQPGRIVIASGCVRGEGAGYELVPPEFPAVADPFVVSAMVQAAEELGEDVLVGLFRSHDCTGLEVPWNEEGKARIARWARLGVEVIDGETSALFVISSILKLHAASLALVTDNHATSDHLENTDEGRKTLFRTAAEVLVCC